MVTGAGFLISHSDPPVVEVDMTAKPSASIDPLGPAVKASNSASYFQTRAARFDDSVAVDVLASTTPPRARRMYRLPAPDAAVL